MAAKFIAVAKTADIPEGQAREVEAGGRAIALCRVEGQFYAVENVCTHADEPLAPCRLEGHSIECPRHGARFDVRNGEVLRMPAAFPLATLETRVEGDTVLVKVDGDE